MLEQTVKETAKLSSKVAAPICILACKAQVFWLFRVLASIWSCRRAGFRLF